ncbi:MAG: tRNA (adenosine(37)-N6)-threonylcarbamoyltransferase complex dimerization subunit type 1 TsaB [Gammaproteobacteria bacterium]|nr:tRNA (adenosine(37)-N6)-threonylcarbamoyltransferase complex dimerization subunit type 1 TsaB [Gammaproteobacteria bacterium]
MNLLAIETATEACSAALYIDGEIEQRFKIAPREHGSLILGMIDELMAEAQLSVSQLDAIAFGRGPGSFIGVRIAAGVTQGIAFGAGLPVVPVSTLAAIAQGARHDHLLVAIDARMDEVYWGQYSRSAANGTVCERAPERLLLPDEILVVEASDSWVGVGTGWETYRESLQRRLPFVTLIDNNHYPMARSTAVLGAVLYQQGQMVAAEEAIPVYLRDRVAEKPSN